LLLANAARYLAKRGKGVVALDFDFEAPGLHYKFDEVRELAGGVVPYLIAMVEGSTSAPPFDDHMISVPVSTAAGGWVRLTPAGPAPGRRYWAALKELGERLRLTDLSGRGFMALLDLQARIADELQPDYLLIDARTGVTEFGGLATTVLADTVVCLLVANPESVDGTLAVVEALKSSPRLANQRPIRVVPVLSRTTVWPSLDLEERFALCLLRLVPITEGELIFLPHDNESGTFERSVVGGRNDGPVSPLHKAYTELFQRLFPGTASQQSLT
jgi:hypothetical protein